MTKQKTENFTCPHCKNQRQRTILQSINVDVNPEMRKKIDDLSCFEWRCPICGKISLVVDPCLYHDISGQFMVWLCLEDNPPPASGFDPLADYTLRWVESPNAFREKIKLLEAGLDDRAVEIMKLILAIQLQKSFDIVELLFHAFDERTTRFTFAAVLSDGAEQYVSMEGQTYLRILQDVQERLFTPARDFMKIDMEWAQQALEMLRDAAE